MTDLNTAIVKYKGWKHNPDGFDLGLGNDVNFKYQSPDGKLQSKLPDFERDARLYMSLFKEMSSEFFLLTLMQHDYDNKTIITGDYRQGHNENIPQFIVESQPIGTAICLAYCRLKGIEVVG